MKEWTKPIRTAIQILVIFVPLAPILIPALGLSATAGVGASLMGGAATLSRIMQIDVVEKLLAKLGIESK